jgi:hypothetical protein
MKLFVLACGVTTALGFWTTGHESAKDHASPSFASPAPVLAFTATVDPAAAGLTDVTVEEFRALYEIGAQGITTRRVNTPFAAPRSVAAVAIECGSAEGGVAVFNDTQCGADIQTAMAAAMFGVELKIAVTHPNNCQECPIPGACLPEISTLDTGWSFGLPFMRGGQWCITAKYDGPYLFVCSPCFNDE